MASLKKKEQDRAEYIESLNPTELLVYEVKKPKKMKIL